MSVTRAVAPAEKPLKTKRGRPSREQERVITETIIEAAYQLFIADGYGATSMKRIGEEAGVAPNTLYARFPDKAALFQVIIEWKSATWKVANPPRRPRAGAGLIENLETAVIGMLEAMDREDVSALGRLLALEGQRFPELARIYRDNALAIQQDDLVDRIRNAPDADISEAQADELATTLLEVVVGHAGTRMFQEASARPPSRRQVARRIARVLALGYVDDPR